MRKLEAGLERRKDIGNSLLRRLDHLECDFNVGAPWSQIEQAMQNHPLRRTQALIGGIVGYGLESSPSDAFLQPLARLDESHTLKQPCFGDSYCETGNRLLILGRGQKRGNLGPLFSAQRQFV